MGLALGLRRLAVSQWSWRLRHLPRRPDLERERRRHGHEAAKAPTCSRSGTRPTKGQGIPELFEQFDWAAGGRLEVLGKNPKCAGYQVMAAGEGIEKWEATIIYPKETLLQIFSTSIRNPGW